MGNCKQKKKSSNEFVRTQGNTCTMSISHYRLVVNTFYKISLRFIRGINYVI